MFGDSYIAEIGSNTEELAKVALAKCLVRQFQASDDLRSGDRPLKIAAAVVNRVFGEHSTSDKGGCFAAENASLIEQWARWPSQDEGLCKIFSGAAYNACYSRYLRAGGSRGMFSNSYLTFIRCIGRDDSHNETRSRARLKINSLGPNVLAPIESMTELGIMRELPHRPNEREFYDALADFYKLLGESPLVPTQPHAAPAQGIAELKAALGKESAAGKRERAELRNTLANSIASQDKLMMVDVSNILAKMPEGSSVVAFRKHRGNFLAGIVLPNGDIGLMLDLFGEGHLNPEDSPWLWKSVPDSKLNILKRFTNPPDAALAYFILTSSGKYAFAYSHLVRSDGDVQWIGDADFVNCVADVLLEMGLFESGAGSLGRK